MSGIDPTLADRHERETSFHDEKYAEEGKQPAVYRFNPTARVFRRMKQIIGDVRDKNVLEYGCGTGWITIQLAQMGARLHAFDISNEAVKHTDKLLRGEFPDRPHDVRRMPAEALEFPDQHFDLVFGFAILHHLDLPRAMPELHRVLKPGGLACFAEPLGSNPLINAYRRSTPQFRTPDERPIILPEFARHARVFSRYEHEEFYLTALLPLALSRFFSSRKLFDGILNPFMALDRGLLSVLPSAGRWAWYSIFRLHR